MIQLGIFVAMASAMIFSVTGRRQALLSICAAIISMSFLNASREGLPQCYVKQSITKSRQKPPNHARWERTSLRGTLHDARLLDLVGNALLDQRRARTNWRMHLSQMGRTYRQGHWATGRCCPPAASVTVGVDFVELADELLFAGGTSRCRGLGGAVAEDVHRSSGTGL